MELGRLEEHRPAVRILRELESLLDAVAPGGGSPEKRVARARAAHPALDRLLPGLVGTVIVPTVAEAPGPANVVPERATATLQCLTLPGTTLEELERELRAALGAGTVRAGGERAQGGDLVSPAESPLAPAIRGFLAEHEPEARLLPALGYGFSDCNIMREAYGSVAYGFIPFATPTR